MNETQVEELEALHAIYDKDFTDITPQPPSFMVRLTDENDNVTSPIFLNVIFTEMYPEECPLLQITSRSHRLLPQHNTQLCSHLKDLANSLVGEAMVFTLVDAAKEWLSNLPEAETSQTTEQEEMHEETEEPVVVKPLAEPKAIEGRWDYTIGLVGKPSAGKSTFFNAAVNQDMAKVGAHPFTTIEPNIGRAFYTIPCPCSRLSPGQLCDAAYGHNHAGERYVPLLLKDVAGLVPGACDGKGRGNRFLNDLLDADVLVHVVDASGCTNEKGEQTTDYDPSEDVEWLQHEIHRWVYDNVMDKWDAIKRRPAKLLDMFTGYHANLATIHIALHRAGIDNKRLSEVSGWSEDVLHRIVKEFLSVRFPIFLALNKADTDTAQKHIIKLKEIHGEASMAVSSRSECQLQQMVKSGSVEYHSGGRNPRPSPEITPEHEKQLHRIQQTILDRHESTNVQRALSAAVHLRQPVYAFPVHDLGSLCSIDRYRDEPPGTLRDCLSLRQGTTAHSLYNVMSHYPTQLLAGDFIRAECLENGVKRIMKKEEGISESNCIIKIMTNRKIGQIKTRE